jgi:outer membrane protein TolC
MVNFTVFDGLARENKILAAKAGRNMVDYEIADAEFNIESLVVKQYEELMKHRELYDCSSTSIESANEALRTAVLGFKEGYRTSLEVTDAELALSKVKIERLQAMYNYDTTLTELLKTNGNTKDILHFISISQKEGF